MKHAATIALLGTLAYPASAQEPPSALPDICEGQAAVCLAVGVSIPLIAGAVALYALGEGIEAACIAAGFEYLPPDGDGWQWRCTGAPRQ